MEKKFMYRILMITQTTSLCVTSSGQIIVSQQLPSIVFCMDIYDRVRLWSIEHLPCPTGVTTDRYGYLLVYFGAVSSNKVQIGVLRADTGW